ncbi:MAG: phosphopentomutase [bacterium]|nr:phosphopentomutase [bacterium]
MTKIKRTIVIVLDSVGVGELPDAGEYGDIGSNTLGHIAEQTGGLKLPNMQKMGLGNIIPIKGVKPTETPTASWGKMKEASKSKDTMAGHWEMMGLIVKKPFPIYPEGFGKEILQKFYDATGFTMVLGNKAASGTVIIEELGDEHVKTGQPIVYTSGDSVFQIAVHEEVVPLDKLYDVCNKTRKICDEYQIGRVIARPFIGENGSYTRTANRRDFPMDPPGETALVELKRNNFPVMGIGKIEDIFVGQGITRALHTKSNSNGMECLMEELEITNSGLIFVNLVDFDMLFGHRNNTEGYGKSLEEFDVQLGQLLPMLEKDDLLIITADHGCDPTFPGTDHTREHVPLLAYNEKMEAVDLGTRDTFADIAATLLKVNGISHPFPGKSFV